MSSQKQYCIIAEAGVYHICMKGLIPDETEKVNIVLATLDEQWLPFEAKEMAQAICDLLNSQASSIQFLLDENFEIKKKCIELTRKIIPFGGPRGDG